MTEKSYYLSQWFLINLDFQIHFVTIGNYTAVCSVPTTNKSHLSLQGTDYNSL